MDHNVFDQPEPELDDFKRAKEFLQGCQRLELRDHAFGDREITWMIGDEEVAGGYFGGGDKEVWIHEDHGGGLFHGTKARQLAVCGRDPIIGRNDETGPDEYEGS